MSSCARPARASPLQSPPWTFHQSSARPRSSMLGASRQPAHPNGSPSPFTSSRWGRPGRRWPLRDGSWSDDGDRSRAHREPPASWARRAVRLSCPGGRPAHPAHSVARVNGSAPPRPREAGRLGARDPPLGVPAPSRNAPVPCASVNHVRRRRPARARDCARGWPPAQAASVATVHPRLNSPPASFPLPSSRASSRSAKLGWVYLGSEAPESEPVPCVRHGRVG